GERNVMSAPHHSGDHHGHHPAPETDHTHHHPDHASHEHHADVDTYGQAMSHDHPHSALDEDLHVHGHGEHAGHSTAMFRDRFWWSRMLSIPVAIFSPWSPTCSATTSRHSPDPPGSPRCWARSSSSTAERLSSRADGKN